jgi:hypothetical protein
MPKLFSVLSWNIEHFKDDPTPTRVNKVVDFVKLQNPDVFGIFEVEGKTIFDALVSRMPDFTFQITEGEETQEILVGVNADRVHHPENGVQVWNDSHASRSARHSRQRWRELCHCFPAPRQRPRSTRHGSSGRCDRVTSLRQEPVFIQLHKIRSATLSACFNRTTAQSYGLIDPELH